MRKAKANLHAHSNVTDGKLTPGEIEALARLVRMYIAITDHNRVDGVMNTKSKYILPGIEVTFQEPQGMVDLLFYADTRTALQEFFDNEIADYANKRNFALPIDRNILEVVQAAKKMGMEIIVPHYGERSCGICILDRETQQQIVIANPLVEINGQFKDSINDISRAFADQMKLQIITAGDSHMRNHYATSFTSIPVKKKRKITATELIRTAREHPELCEHTIREPVSRREKAVTGFHIWRKCGTKMMVRCGWQSFRNRKKPNGALEGQPPLSRAPRKEDAVCVDDS